MYIVQEPDIPALGTKHMSALGTDILGLEIKHTLFRNQSYLV